MLWRFKNNGIKLIVLVAKISLKGQTFLKLNVRVNKVLNNIAAVFIAVWYLTSTN